MPTVKDPTPKRKIRCADWPEEAVGHRVTTHVPLATEHETLHDVQKSIENNIKALQTINYVYVLDHEGKLVGIVSIKDLFRYPGNTRIGNICRRHGIITIRPDKRQERAAYFALQHNIKAIPVVDKDRVFLGVVPSDTILSILYRDVHEDMLHLVGIHNSEAVDNILQIPVWRAFLHRAPWLLIGLIGGFSVAGIIGFFENTLEANLILASFIPLIIYMSGAVGTQMEAFMIRDLALDHHLPFFKYFLKQLIVVLMIAVSFGVLLFVATNILYHDVGISTVLGVSLFAAIASSVVSGMVVPYTFSRMKLDPANASGPLVTIIQDMLGVVIYFGIASFIL